MEILVDVQEACLVKGFDLEQLLGDLMPQLDRRELNSFGQIVKNKLSMIFSGVDVGNTERVTRNCVLLTGYIELVRTYEDFRQAQLREVGPTEDTCGQSDETEYICSEYQRLMGKPLE